MSRAPGGIRVRGARVRRWRFVSAALVVGATSLSATPSPTPPPVFRLYRTAEAAHVDPGSTNPLFVLVVGSDVREGDPSLGRADSLHVVAVDTVRGRGTVVGIPRDSWVEVPGVGRAKITESLYHGGPGLLVRSVHDLTGLPIHYWALIDFSRFRTLVDRLGGIELDIPAPMHDWASGSDFEPGRRLLNGAQALAFARDRHSLSDGDVGRSLNQGRLLLAALSKFRAETAEPFGLLRYLREFRSLVATNVGVGDLLRLGAIGRRVDPGAVRNVVIPVRLGEVGQASVVFVESSARGVFDALRDDAEL